MQQLDVRTIPPRERHPRIFNLFDELAPGAAFELVNDHDPKPLYYQFQAERAGQVSWEYLEEGPETWRVRIGKVGPAPSFDENMTVNELVSANPESQKVLAEMGIDTCCGGGSSLAAAAKEAGLQPEQVIDAVARLARA